MSTIIKTPEKQVFLDMFARIDEKWNAGDRSAYLENYDDNSFYMVPHQETIDNYDGIEAFVKEFPDVKLEHGLVDLWGDEDSATVHGQFKIRNKDKSLMDKGKFLAHYRKNSLGKWMITHSIWNSDLPAQS